MALFDPQRIESIIQLLNKKHIFIVFFILILPAVFSPYHSDDYFQLLLLDSSSALSRNNDGSLWGLFSFVDQVPEHREQMQRYGVLPWFAAEDFWFRFYRPVTEITHWIDYRLFGINPMPAHIHSILWFVLLGVVFYRVVKQTLPQEKLLPLLAFAIFVWDGQHVATISWIANRNALIAAVFALLALSMHINWRKHNNKFCFFAAMTFFLLSLLSSESGLSIFSYLFFYAIFLDVQSRKSAALSLLPYGTVIAIWYYHYSYLGFGVNTSLGLYINPFTESLEYVRAVLYRLPIYFLSSLLPVPAGISWGGGAIYAWLGSIFYAASLFFIITFFVIFYKVIKRNNNIAFWLFSSMGALLPICGTLAQDRLVIFQTIGMDVVIAMLIFHFMRSSDVRLLYRKAVLIVLLFIHIVLSPLHLLLGSAYIYWGTNKILNNALSIFEDDVKQKNVLVFKAPIGEAVSLIGIREVMNRSNPQNFIWLSNDEGVIKINVLSDRSVQVEKPLGFANGFESAFRSVQAEPFFEGEKIAINDLEIEIVHINEYQYPDIIVIHFNESFNKNAIFYSYKDGSFYEVSINANKEMKL